MGVILVIVMIGIIAFFMKRSWNSLNPSEATGNWSHLFLEMEQDPEEFYQLVEQILAETKVPGIKTGRKTFKQGGAFSNHRVYLEVSRSDYIFHICGAPWGTGFFFAWWLREKLSVLDKILVQIPFIGQRIVDKRQYKSYYKIDTDIMFRTSVQESVQEAIKRLTEAKGIRGLSELERKPDLRTIIKQ